MIAGILATIAAVVAFLVGLASAEEPGAAAAISWRAWGGVVFSFATIFLGAISRHARSMAPGLLVVAASLGGTLAGSTLVGAFLGLAMVGGLAHLLAVALERARAREAHPAATCLLPAEEPR